MKPDLINQEILFLANSTFSRKQFFERNDVDHRSDLDNMEQLEEHCWNGLLDEMLPEILHRPSHISRLCLWQIRQANAYLIIELRKFSPVDRHSSIDPYSFLLEQAYN